MGRKRKARNAVAALVEEGRVYNTYVFDGSDPAWDPSDDTVHSFPTREWPERRLLHNVSGLAEHRYRTGRVVPDNEDGEGLGWDVLPLHGRKPKA